MFVAFLTAKKGKCRTLPRKPVNTTFDIQYLGGKKKQTLGRFLYDSVA